MLNVWQHLDDHNRELSVLRDTMSGMPSWTDGPRLALDTETTGKDPGEAHLVTACILRIDGDGTVLDTRNWLADPGIEIPAEAAEVHGVTTEMAREQGQPEAGVLAEISEYLRTYWNPTTPVVIYNAYYDLTLLSVRMRNRGIESEGLPILGPVLDALVFDRVINRYRKGKRKLIMNCERYGVALSEADAHSADADCRAAHDLTWAMAARHAELRNATLRDLYIMQRRGHRAWAENFQDWLRRQPRTAEETDEEEAARRAVVIDTDWPMRADVVGPRAAKVAS